ncbi:MAG: UDP-glucose/GDP-mannose dehydrogenase family protein [Myxococcales bacterium]|jgi:UDPglucose 6-dehydrogenase|nr:UDP-glucose/GDP-mannose dehydrogenase family protein [Myxococcales bacterium]
MKLAIIGTGYVGLVAGTCFADSGNQVICVDANAAKIAQLQAGRIPIYEPGLTEMVQKNVRQERLRFSTCLEEAVRGSEIIFIAVGTPPGENGEADLGHVLAVARDIGRALTTYAVVVDKSTVPVGTADRVRELIAAETDVPFDVVSNPEFLKEGAAIMDFLKPDRVVIGTDSERARHLMAQLYAPFVRTQNPILFMDTRSAELTKYASNAMLAARISFMNEIALLCERTGADVDHVRKGMGADRRIGYPFLFPGVGYGGSCFPKDVQALLATNRQHGLDGLLLQAVEAINARQKQLLVDKAVARFGEDLRGHVFAIWGLSFKPNTDDLREAPSLVVIDGLLQRGAKLQITDPIVTRDIAGGRIDARALFCPGPYEAAEGADALFVITEWNDYRHPDFDRLRQLMRQPIVFDGRNIFSPAAVAASGFEYCGVGRG